MSIKKIMSVGALALAAAVISTGCAYRTDLAQGNFVEQEAVNRLRYGMTQSQVQYALGSPMLTDPFDSSRWYYVHFLRRGWDDPEVKNLILKFNGNTLVDMAGDFKKPLQFNDINAVEQKIDLSRLHESAGAASAEDNTGPAIPVYKEH